jgi:hypothetical protein
MHPGFLTVVMMDDRFEREFRHAPWFAVQLCYWAALVVNFVVARRWLIRHFDRLAGRAAPPGSRHPAGESAPSSLARSRPTGQNAAGVLTSSPCHATPAVAPGGADSTR